MKQVLILGLLAAQVFCARYELDVVTGSKANDGTDGSFEGTLIGSKGRVNFGVLDNAGVNDFQLGAVDNFKAPDSSSNVGKIECVEIAALSDDAWMVDYIIVHDKASNSKTYVYNTEGEYLSSDTGEGKDKMQFCKQGDATYKLEITTADVKNAGTNTIHARVTMSSKGKKGSTTTGFLDNKEINDFERGAVDTFVLHNLKNVGWVGCISITVEGDDAWLFETITVKREKMSRTFENKDRVWLSSDLKEASKTDKLDICL